MTSVHDPRAVIRSVTRIKGTIAPILVYLAAAVVCTWPLAAQLSTSLGAPVGPGDPFLYVWALGWGMHTVLTNPAALFTGRVFDANIFHPAAGTLTYSDHLLLQSAALAPLYAITGDVVICYNVLLIVSLALSALAMHVFVSSVVGSTGSAYLAGLAWGFGAYRFAHLIHIQLQALYFLPIAFLFLHRFVADGRFRTACALAVTTALQAVASVYYGVIGGLGLAVAGLTLVMTTGRPIRRDFVLRGACALGIAGLLVLPVGFVYWRVQQEQGFGRNLEEAGRHAATISSYVQAAPGNILYGWTGLLLPGSGSSQPPEGDPEHALFPGFVVLALAATGLWRGWRSDARPLVLTMTALALAGFVLSLGPDGVRPLYSALHRYVFGFQAIRAPARFAVLTLFALTTLAAVGWREWSTASAGSRFPLRRMAPAVLLVLAAIECLHIPRALAAAPPRRTTVGEWLRSAPGNGAVAVLPLAHDLENTVAMVQSLEHRRPLLNGYSGQRPFHFTALVDSLSTFPADEALLALREGDVRYVVTREPLASSVLEGGPTPLHQRAVFPDGAIYELVWTPELETRVASAAAVLPPSVGPIPFVVGEHARYAVAWEATGLNVTAGEIAITVEPPEYRFVVTAVTAPWLARFFEARDRFETTVDRQLLPLVHTRELHEGSRNVRRAFAYDRARGVVRVAPSAEEAAAAEAVSLPLAPSARDAIATVFFIRTLALERDARLTIPVNEGGGNLLLELNVIGREAIPVDGQVRDAIRVEPRIRRRVERRPPPTATVWLSADRRQIPLAFEVRAGFGRVRAELIEYRSP
jgi:hypothetical protein